MISSFIDFIKGVGKDSALQGTTNVMLGGIVGQMEKFSQSVGFLDGVDWDAIKPFGNLGYWEKIYSTLGQTNTSLGISGNLAEEFNKLTTEGIAGALAVGGNIDDLTKSYESFLSKFGRSTLIDDKSMIDMVKLQKAFGEDFGDMLVTTKLTGKSIRSTYKFINKATLKANKMGVNISNVIKKINKNIGLIDEYNFVNGVKGLEKMALLSEKTMISMDSA